MKEIEIRKKNGDILRGVLFLPQADPEKRPFPLLIVSHGFGACYKDLWHHGSPFAADGIACLLFDFRGGSMTSASGGSMQEMSLLTEKEDLDYVLDYAAALPGIDRRRIFLLGESQGGLVSAMTAADRPHLVRGLILWYPAFVIPKMAADLCARGIPDKVTVFEQSVGRIYIEDALKVDIRSVMQAYPGPVLLIHGDCDTLVPLSWSLLAHEIYRDSRLEIIPDAGHDFVGPGSTCPRQLSAAFIKSLV